MSDEKQYDVVFEGHLVEGADPGVVRDNVAALFKTAPGKLDKLFSGKRFVIKSRVGEQTARKYQQAMRKAGALCNILKREDESADGNMVRRRFILAPPGVVMDDTTPPAAPSIDTTSLSMLEPGVDMDDGASGSEEEVPHPLDADIAPPGVDLVEPSPVVARDICIDGLSLAERGADLVEGERTERFSVPDVSHITLASAEHPEGEESGPASSYLKSLGID